MSISLVPVEALPSRTREAGRWLPVVEAVRSDPKTLFRVEANGLKPESVMAALKNYDGIVIHVRTEGTGAGRHKVIYAHGGQWTGDAAPKAAASPAKAPAKKATKKG